MNASLFPELASPDSREISERLITAYAADLLESPPVNSVDPSHQPDPARRQQAARRLAHKDIARMRRALAAAGLEIVEGRQDAPQEGASR